MPSHGRRDGRTLKITYLWKIILERVTCNDVISEAVVRMYVVLSKAEKRMSYRGISWYHRVFDVISEVSHKIGYLQPSSTSTLYYLHSYFISADRPTILIQYTQGESGQLNS